MLFGSGAGFFAVVPPIFSSISWNLLLFTFALSPMAFQRPSTSGQGVNVNIKASDVLLIFLPLIGCYLYCDGFEGFVISRRWYLFYSVLALCFIHFLATNDLSDCQFVYSGSSNAANLLIARLLQNNALQSRVISSSLQQGVILLPINCKKDIYTINCKKDIYNQL